VHSRAGVNGATLQENAGNRLRSIAVRIDIGRLLPAFPVTPPDMRVRIRRFGGLSYRPTVNLGIPSESK
jgi:hypothetical protein